MTINLNLANLKKTTVALLLAISGGTLVTQTVWIQTHLLPLLAKHPHWATLVPGVLVLLTVLHDPRVITILQSVEQKNVTQTQTTTETATTTMTVAATTPVVATTVTETPVSSKPVEVVTSLPGTVLPPTSTLKS